MNREEAYQQITILRDTAERLSSLATAFYAVGQESVYYRLSAHTGTLNDVALRLEKIITKGLDHSLEEAQVRAYSVLSAMVENAKDKEPEE